MIDSVLTINGKPIKKEAKFQIWRNKRIPFGITKATMTIKYKLPKVAGITGSGLRVHYEFTLDDFGTGAKPFVSVEARKKKFPERPKIKSPSAKALRAATKARK